MGHLVGNFIKQVVSAAAQPICRMSADGNVKRAASPSVESTKEINIMLTV